MQENQKDEFVTGRPTAVVQVDGQSTEIGGRRHVRSATRCNMNLNLELGLSTSASRAFLPRSDSQQCRPVLLVVTDCKMSGKTLSNGTLGLRFMQNARSKQTTQVEADRAKVKDDGEWGVTEEIREAWGIGSSSKPPLCVQIHDIAIITNFNRNHFLGKLSLTKLRTCRSYFPLSLGPLRICPLNRASRKAAEISIRKVKKLSRR